MNYYPNNLYASYPYNNLYQPNQYSPQQSLNNFNQSSMGVTNNPMSLLGKIVDGEEVVKATEIPLGGFGVFPKADLTEIYIKSWNNNGTTQIIRYQPIVATTEEKQESASSIILEKINNIEAKLDGLVGSALPQQSSTLLKSSTSDKRKELNVNAY